MWSSRFELKIIVLALLAVAVVSLGAVNLREQRQYQLPDDGVFWVESGQRVIARDVIASGPADAAGLRAGDILLSINGRTVAKASELSREVFKLGVGGRARYQVLRQDAPAEFEVVLEARTRAVRSSLQLVGWLYLIMGLFVLFRRFRASRATHFYLFCLASFVLFVFSYTGKLNTFDWVVYWTNAAALLLQPALFAHFCLVYPGAQDDPERHETRGLNRKFFLFWIYASAAALGTIHVAVAAGVLRFSAPLAELRWLLDRLEMGYLVLMFLLGISFLAFAFRKTQSHYVRRQMAWVLLGSLLAVAPFAAFYGVPYLLGVIPGKWMNLSALSLILLPLTFSYAIARHRLLDGYGVLERGVSYTLATGVLVSAYFGIAALAGDLFRASFPAGGTIGVVTAVIATGLLFQPLKRWIEARLEHHFLPQRHDYREALLAFGRELGSETELRSHDPFFARSAGPDLGSKAGGGIPGPGVRGGNFYHPRVCWYGSCRVGRPGV